MLKLKVLNKIHPTFSHTWFSTFSPVPAPRFEHDEKPSPSSTNNNARESIICTVDAYNLQIILGEGN